MDEALYQRAAERIASADALLIAAGAGMGVDSGLPDFRGDRGFWNAYPPYEKLGLNFVALASPRWFRDDPTLAWGFYGHRRNLSRATQSHDGFRILRDWAAGMRHGACVFTSNVDDHFQRAGFDPERVAEVHGSGEWLQCTRGCGAGIFANTNIFHLPDTRPPPHHGAHPRTESTAAFEVAASEASPVPPLQFGGGTGAKR